MIYLDITSFVRMIQLETDYSIIEMHCLKNAVVFFQTILSFMLSRKIIKIYKDIVQKHGNVNCGTLLLS